MRFLIPLCVPLLLLISAGLIQGQSTGIFYPFGAGDIVNIKEDDGSSPAIFLLQPFIFFGKTYNQIYVNYNGDLTFDQPWYSYTPYQFPANGGRDIIAPFWTDIDNRLNGVISYQQYTSGSVLTQATQDINRYFPQLRHRATWVFVTTWDRVAYFPNSGTETSFQVVLISDGQLSFILMNYGQVASTNRNVQAGYDTDDSSNYFSIPGSFQYNYTGFTYSSNVNVTGRWVFRVDQGSQTCLFNGAIVPQGTSFWTDASCQQKCTCSRRGLQCSSQPCTFSQACRPAAFQYSCQNIQRQTCTISGDPHYYTFDNQIFHFQGTCTYVLSEVCGRGLPYYRIEGKNENRGSTLVAWTRLVRVFVYNEVLELVKDHRYQAKVNGTLISTPFSLRNGSIQVYQSGGSVSISTDFGLVVTYDAYHYVTISVPYDYQNATCGLCGNFNHRAEDDFRTPSGQIVRSDLDFANSWKVPGDTDPSCQNSPCSGLACAACTTAQSNLYRSTTYCGVLANVSGPFATCQQRVSPQTFIENCVYDLCVGGGYQPILCQALNVYAAQCQQQGIQLGQWRRPGFCEIPCPAHSHFETQGTSCPATCSNPSAPSNCPLPNQESCICDAGYVLSAGECVPQANCGCTFEGLYYANGQSVVLGADCGRQCVCSNRVMSCQNHQCGQQETCGLYNGVRGCRPTSYATCMVEGLGTYRTFDGVTFRYPGACALTLSRVTRPTMRAIFAVTLQKVPRGPQNFTTVLSIEIEGTQVSIEMTEGGNAQVDGQIVALPFSVSSGRILIYHSSVKGVIIETTFGITVRADWPRLIRITAPSTYNGTLGGLCGNLNGNRADDFSSPGGVLVNDSQVFGDSWRNGSLSGYCVESADIWQQRYYQNTSWFTQNCSIMASARGPFAQCHNSLDPRQWVTDCILSLEQTRGAKEALCEALRGYSVRCQQNGIAVGEWRNITNCEFPCPANSHYELCGTSCPAACPSLSFPFLCTQRCQEGCQCNDGFLLSGDLCVPPTGCGCLHEGRYRQGGERFWHGEQCQSLCVCDGTTGFVRCVPSSCTEQEICSVVGGEFGCHPQRRATCSASGDPHYTSFDGRRFDFQGTCRYILASVCNNTRRLPHFQVSARNEAWNGLAVSVTVDVYVSVSGHLVHISRNMRGSVEIDNERRNLPVLLDSGRVSIYSSGQNTFIMTDFGLSVSYDEGSWRMTITIPANYSGATCGLCGNFNGQMSDDFITSSGVLVTSASQFGASWKIPNDTSCNDGCGDSCTSCPDQTRAQAQCAILRDRQGPFSFCHAYVDPQAYFNDCTFDVCLSGHSNDVLCRSIQTYVSACQSVKANIYTWRQNTTCRMDCPANSHYELCGTDCGHTCASSIDGICERTCSEGCFCNEGFVRSGALCVPVDQCGCLYNGLYFHIGEQFWTPGCSQRCECFAPNDLRCFSTSCSPTEECTVRNGQRGCYSQMSSCMVWGDPHYLTFDGALVTFQGTCSYEISRTCGYVGNNDLGFRVVATNVHRGNMAVSFVSEVNVWLNQGSQNTQISIGQNGRVKVDGNIVNSTAFQISRLAEVHQERNIVVVNASSKLMVYFDGSSTLSVRLGPSFRGSVCGMCGNNNGDPADDKALPNRTLAPSDAAFGNSWKSNTSSPGCDANDQTEGPTACPFRVRYSDLCSIITNTRGPFHLCHGHVNPEPYFTSCVYDLCAYSSTNDMLCSAVEAYEAACTMVQLQISDWRSGLSCSTTPRTTSTGITTTIFPRTSVSLRTTSNSPGTSGTITTPERTTVNSGTARATITQQATTVSTGTNTSSGPTNIPRTSSTTTSTTAQATTVNPRTSTNARTTITTQQTTVNRGTTVSPITTITIPQAISISAGTNISPGSTSMPRSSPITISTPQTTDIPGTAISPKTTSTIPQTVSPGTPTSPRTTITTSQTITINAGSNTTPRTTPRTITTSQIIDIPGTSTSPRTTITTPQTTAIPGPTTSPRAAIMTPQTTTGPRTITPLQTIYIPGTATSPRTAITIPQITMSPGTTTSTRIAIITPQITMSPAATTSPRTTITTPQTITVNPRTNILPGSTNTSRTSPITNTTPQTDIPGTTINRKTTITNPQTTVSPGTPTSPRTTITTPQITMSPRTTASPRTTITTPQIMSPGTVTSPRTAIITPQTTTSPRTITTPQTTAIPGPTTSPRTTSTTPQAITISPGTRTSPGSTTTPRTSPRTFTTPQTTTVSPGTISTPITSSRKTFTTPERRTIYPGITTTPRTTVNPCEMLNCTKDEWCGQRDGVYGCFCNADHPRPHPESYDATKVCESSSGTISLSRCQLFEAGFPGNSLHLSDPSCRGTVQNGRLVFHFDNDDHICGTNLTANGTHFIYENTIQGGQDSSSSIINKHKKLQLLFSCNYQLTQTLTMKTQLNPLQSTVHKSLPGGVGMYQVSMTPYQDAGFSHPYNGSENLEINQRIYVGVFVQGVDSRQITTVIDSCWATPENDRDYAIRWDLIIKQCPNPNDNSVEVLQNGVSTTTHFSFKMFAFDGYPKVYLHCSIHLCLVQSNSCALHCYPGSQQRSARSVGIHDTSSISVGPFTLTERSTGI